MRTHTDSEKDDPARIKVTSSGPALFSAADEAAVGFLSLDAFEESLLYHVLFANGLLLHEAYFFDSSLLLRHVERHRGGTSLFEEAAKNGLIVPAYRDRQTQSLRDAHRVLKRAYGGKGSPIPEGLLNKHLRTISAVDIGTCLPGHAPVYWPDPGPKGELSLGCGYEETVRQLLSGPEPPIREEDSPDRKQLMERAWAQSKEWRTACVEEACERTREKGEFGLQRYELHRAVSISLGVKNLLPFQELVTLTKAVDPEKSLALDLFFRWITHCHWKNMSDRFGVKTSLPRYDLDKDFIADVILSQEPVESPKKSFQCEVNLPSYEALSQIPVRELVAIRISDGQAYQEELQKAALYPDANETGIRESLQEYCQAIGNYVANEVVYKSPTNYIFATGSMSSTVLQTISKVPSIGAAVAAAGAGVGAVIARHTGESAAAMGVFIGGTAALLGIYPLIREQWRATTHKGHLKPRSTGIEFSIGPTESLLSGPR